MPAYTHNVWLPMSGEFQTDLKNWCLYQEPDNPQTPPVNFPLIEDIASDTVEFLRTAYNHEAVERLFRKWQAAGRSYRCWNVFIIKPENWTTIKADLDMLVAAYPNDFSVAGVWNYSTGRNLGGDENPTYPAPPQLINFMPRKWDHSTSPPTAIEPTELTDVILGAGQAPRVFV